MRGSNDGDRVAYQPLLRAVGAFLDEAGACEVTVIEVDDGFQARYRIGESPEMHVADLPQNELVEGSTRRRRRRPRPLSRLSERGGNEAEAGYEDVLRTVGYELEQAGAYTMLLDETDSAMVLTYQYLDARDTYLPHKRMVVVDAEGVQEAVDVARARRDVRWRRPGWLRGLHESAPVGERSPTAAQPSPGY